MSNLVIVAIPDKNDHVWKVSSEKVPHLTVLFLGETNQIANVDKIVEFVEHAANTTLNRFYLSVDSRGELGDDKADVLFFKKTYEYKAIRDFRAVLLQDTNIRTAYDSATQFEGPWNPHLTLGYPATPAKPDENDYGLYSVGFNKIAVWTGDFEGPEFPLKDFWDEYETLETVPMDVAMSDIQHYGVKGMRWGMRKEQPSSSSGASSTSITRKVGSGLKKVAKDIYFETDWAKDNATSKVTSAASKKWAEEDVPRLNAQYKGTKAATVKSRLKNPVAQETIEYRSRSRAAYRDRLNEEVAKLPGNVSNTRRYEIEDGGSTNANYFWHLKAVDVKRRSGLDHAATDEEVALLDFRVRPTFDEDGLIIGFKQIPIPKEDAMAQTVDLGAAFLAHNGVMGQHAADPAVIFLLEHYGIKGMHWGVRTAAPPSPVSPSASSRVPHGTKRKTKIDTEGGENHPAHTDALKVAESRAKLKKSGTAALSNKELREMANRIQLEQQVKDLTAPGGKKWVTGFLRRQGEQSAGRVVTRKAIARGL